MSSDAGVTRRVDVPSSRSEHRNCQLRRRVRVGVYGRPDMNFMKKAYNELGAILEGGDATCSGVRGVDR